MKTDRYLLDTNILLRLKNKLDKDHPATQTAIQKLILSGASLHTCTLNMIEYRAVVTRALENNGYALSSLEAMQDIASHEAMFPILLDSLGSSDVYPLWRKLVEGAGTVGKQNHDARILAVAEAHACTHLLTFNHQDFDRYSSLAPNITIINPNDL